MGQSTKDLLPEDIEEQLKKVQGIISELVEKKAVLEKYVEDGEREAARVADRINIANAELARITQDFQSINQDLSQREEELRKKESALSVYSTALQEKEKKINKYLTIFENMKDVIS